jgi:hypothetical protein
MFGMNLLADLALAFFFGMPLVPWSDLDRPVADVGLYCSTDEVCQVECPSAKPPRLYEVEVKLGKKMSPILRLLVGQRAQVTVPAWAAEGPCELRIHLASADESRVRVELEMQTVGVVLRAGQDDRGSLGTGVFRGGKTVNLDTVTGLVLSGDNDPEPFCAQVTVRAIATTALAQPMPVEPLPCPYPAVSAPLPAPVALWAAQPVVVPEPMPHLAPTKVMRGPFGYSGQFVVPEPMPMPAAVVPAGAVQLCTAIAPCPPARGTQVRLLHGCGKSRLHMKADGCSTTCVRMVLERGEAGALKVAAGKKFVHVAGKQWKAHADQVEVCADGRVILSGHVKLISDRIGVCASVKAEKLCVQVRHGCLDRIVEK